MISLCVIPRLSPLPQSFFLFFGWNILISSFPLILCIGFYALDKTAGFSSLEGLAWCKGPIFQFNPVPDFGCLSTCDCPSSLLYFWRLPVVGTVPRPARVPKRRILISTQNQAAAFKVCKYILVQAGGARSVSATDLWSQVIWWGPLGGSHKGQGSRRELHLRKQQNFVKYFPMSHSISHLPSILFYPPNISITSPHNGLSEDLFTPGVYLKQLCFFPQI